MLLRLLPLLREQHRRKATQCRNAVTARSISCQVIVPLQRPLSGLTRGKLACNGCRK